MLCNGTQGNFRHRCVAGAFSLVTFFWAPKESDKTKGRDQMQNVKEKMRNLKLAAVHFWSVRCVENPGDILFEWTKPTNTRSLLSAHARRLR